MAIKKSNVNFFDLLGIDPDESWDQDKFEHILSQKQVEWSRKSNGVGRRALDAKSNLDLIPQIRSIMSNSAQRNDYKAAIQGERLAGRETKYQEFVQQLRLMLARGYLEEDEKSSLFKDFGDILSVEAISDHIQVEQRRFSPEKTYTLPIDPSIITAIKDRLGHLGIASLYELLAQPYDASREELHRAAVQLYANMVQRRDATSEVKAKLELAGYAQIIFSSDQQRKLYDSILRESSLDRLFENLAKSISHGEIHERQVEIFIEEAQKLDWKPEEALDKLTQHAHQKNWLLPSAPNKSAQKLHNNKQLLQMIAQKQFYTARSFLKRLRPDEINNSQTYRRKIQENITKAENFVKRAHAISAITREQKISYCREALRTCIDCESAQVFLSDLLVPPRNLQPHPANTMMKLTWDPSPLPDITYKVIRKAYSQPTSDTDGIHLGTVSAQIFQDDALEIGVSIYYAVFAVCDEVVSLKGASLQSPIFLTADVVDVNVRVSQQLVDLTWRVPPNVHAIVVIRKEKAPPTSPNDGVRLQLQEMTHLVDHQVQNHCTYFYGIYCQFKDHENVPRVSDGKIVQAMPENHPDAIDKLHIVHEALSKGYAVYISWKPPLSGNKVVILKSAQRLLLKKGDSISKAEVSQYGEVLPEGSMNQQNQYREENQYSCKDFWPSPGICYYTPVILSHGKACIGEPQRYICVEDVTNLTFQQIGASLRLKWIWPENCQEVVVFYGNQDYPRPRSREAIMNSHGVTRDVYDAFGYYDIRGVTNQTSYIVVAAIIEHAGERITASGTRLLAHLARRIIIDYEIRLPGLWRKECTLHLRTQSPAPVRLPAFYMRSKQNGLPLKKDDGDPFFQWLEDIQFIKEYTIPLPDTSSLPRNTFGKLFLEEGMHAIVELRLPTPDKLRLTP